MHLYGDLGWGIVTGLVSEVQSDGRLGVRATLTSEGPELLDNDWDTRLRYDPNAFGGAWIVETMTAEGVVTVPRRWARMLVERLRSSGDLQFADSDFESIVCLVHDRSLEYASMATLRECATYTARALVGTLERAPAVEELFVGPEDLTDLLMTIWCSEDAGGVA